MNEIFALILALACFLVIVWGCRTLPRDGWQMLATLPIRSLADGRWQGINLTWYGVLTANAYLVALTILIILLGRPGSLVRGHDSGDRHALDLCPIITPDGEDR